MIGIVSHIDDLHTREVGRHLDHLGAGHVLIDTAEVPAATALTTVQEPGAPWHGSWSGATGELDLTTLRAMWWRRPQPFRLDDGLRDAADRGFAHGECAAFVAGLWSCLDAEWVNDPDRDERASRKMHQLQLAARLGLRVPRTCMTNDPDRARLFVESQRGAVVFKSFSATPQTWRETRPVRACDLPLMDLVRLAPVIFQEAVAGIDLRVTVVDGQVFPARIRVREGGYSYDFRVDPDPQIDVYRLPAEVQARLLRLLGCLGLRYGAVDLRVTPAGEHVFLEVNPAGQWLFVEMATGQQISAALAEVLVRLDRSTAQLPVPAVGRAEGEALPQPRPRSEWDARVVRQAQQLADPLEAGAETGSPALAP